MSHEQIWSNPQLAPYVLPVVLLAFALHEMGHAFSAHLFGDPTPREHGRITLNPLPHLDIVGTIMLVGSFLLLGFPFGFAVTPINESKMRRPRLHGTLVALAGPIVNVILLAVSLLALAAVAQSIEPGTPLASNKLVLIAYYSTMFNALLVVFNLLPIPPLDGSRVVGGFMRNDLRAKWAELDQYGIFIILGFVFLLGPQFTSLIMILQSILLDVMNQVLGSPLPNAAWGG